MLEIFVYYSRTYYFNNTPKIQTTSHISVEGNFTKQINVLLINYIFIALLPGIMCISFRTEIILAILEFKFMVNQMKPQN